MMNFIGYREEKCVEQLAEVIKTDAWNPNQEKRAKIEKMCVLMETSFYSFQPNNLIFLNVSQPLILIASFTFVSPKKGLKGLSLILSNQANQLLAN